MDGWGLPRVLARPIYDDLLWMLFILPRKDICAQETRLSAEMNGWPSAQIQLGEQSAVTRVTWRRGGKILSGKHMQQPRKDACTHHSTIDSMYCTPSLFQNIKKTVW